MEATETTVEVASSAMLTGTLAKPAEAIPTAGRMTADLVTWILPATMSPSASAATGLIPDTTWVLAAKTIAPAAGRTNV